MQNTSSIGYKTFASQFSQNLSSGKQCSSFEKKSLAIKKDKLTLLHSLGVQNNFSFQQKNDKQLTLLHFAAYFNNPVCALYLLYQNVNMNALDKQGKSVFHLCSYTGHLDVLIYIHEFWKFTKIKQLNENFLKVLLKIGMKRTDSKAGKLKVQGSKQKQQKFSKGQQQITHLYQQYRASYTDFILKSYEKSDVTYNRNCFHYAALNKYQRCLGTLQYMIKSLHNQDLVLSQELLMSLNEISPLISNFSDPRQLEDALSIIKQFIKPETLKNINQEQSQKIKNSMNKILQAKDKDSHTPIYLASKTGSASIVSLLKKLQAKYAQNKNESAIENDEIIKIALNNETRNQITDLCQASKKADVEIINFLISCGEEINKKKTIFGTFALLQAIRVFQKQKNIEPIKILLKSGADVNQQDSNGWTIFHHIAQKGFTEILKLMFHERQQKRISKLNINKTTNKGYHCLHIAAMNNQTEIINILMNPENVAKHQIDVNPLDEQKATILHYAAKKGCLKTMKRILQMKGRALIGARDVNQNTCLHSAAANNHTECVRQIINFDSDYDSLIKIKNKKGKLAKDLTLKKKCFDSIFTAAREGDVNTIRNLLNEKPTLIDSCTPIKARTPLILSVIEMQLVNVKFLVDSKADQYHQDTDGKTASDYAKQLEQVYMKKDKSKIPLIKKIRALLD